MYERRAILQEGRGKWRVSGAASGRKRCWEWDEGGSRRQVWGLWVVRRVRSSCSRYVRTGVYARRGGEHEGAGDGR